MAKNYKTYIIIDFTHDEYGFVNDNSDIKKFYDDLSINIATLPTDSNGYLSEAILVDPKTKEESKILFKYGTSLCIN